MDIKEIPLDELRTDYKETLQDIALCEIALTQGIATYGDGRSTRYRLETNREIAKAIEAELARRHVFSVTVIP